MAEDATWNVFKRIPVVANLYGAGRAFGYACQGDKNRAMESVTQGLLAFMPGGRQAAQAIEDSAVPLHLRWHVGPRILDVARRGDILEFGREVHSHYGMYIGDGNVVHVPHSANNASIREIKCEHVLKASNDYSYIRVRNHDNIAKEKFGRELRSSSDNIVAIAKSYVGQKVPYELFFRNCEFYCTLWRFGIGFSTQAIELTTSGGVVGSLKQVLVDLSLYGDLAKIGHEMMMYEAYRRHAEQNKPISRLQWMSCSQIKFAARPGDVLEFSRAAYSHYGVYIGDGKIINIAMEGGDIRPVVENTLEDACKGFQVRVRNHDDFADLYFDRKPFPDKHVVELARFFLKRELPYEATFRNCEYYATLFRFGKGLSTQVIKQTSEGGQFVGASKQTLVDLSLTTPLAYAGEMIMVKKYKEYVHWPYFVD